MSIADTASKTGRLELFYSSAGHAMMHLLTAFYATIVLALEKDWNLPFHELIALWSLGAILVGAVALPAGWLGDRWSAPGMMVVFFLGIGASSFACGLVDGPLGMIVGLAGIGVFGSIYHPVGIAWVMRTAGKQGRSLGINGIFGSVGLAAAAIVAGVLIDLFSWRAAFFVPGVLCALLGVAMLVQWRAGQLGDRPMPANKGKPPSKGDMVKVFFVLMVTMFFSGIVFQATQYALPKMFEVRLGDILGSGTTGIGIAVAAVYTASGVMQYFAGTLADRFPLKGLYITCFALQIPVLALIASLFGLPLVGSAMLSALLSVGALPAESMLIGRYTPTKHHGIAFGSKFVLAFGAGPVALWMINLIQGGTGEFFWLFILLAGMAAIATTAAFLLPNEAKGDATVQAATKAGVNTPADEMEIAVPAAE